MEGISKRTKVFAIVILLVIPLFLYVGVTVFNDRKYLFIAMLILFATMAPFILMFENRMPKARELMIVAGLSAIGVAGRMAFFWVPQFKPVIAITVVSGVAMGAETGFLVGAMIAFVSNFYFSQGPWTPWQMFCFGLIGFLAGIIFQKTKIKANKYTMSLYGFIVSFAIFGLIMNPASVLINFGTFNWPMIKIAYIQGFYFDLIQALATVIFLFLIGEPMLEKLERIKIKYGFYEEEEEEDDYWEEFL